MDFKNNEEIKKWKSDSEIFDNITEEIYSDVLEMIHEGKNDLSVLEMIKQFGKFSSLNVIQAHLDVQSVHYREIENGVGNRLLERLKSEFKHKDVILRSMYGRDTLIIIREKQTT